MANSLWAITSYFNPGGYRSRVENYHVFRRRLAVPLVTVELSFDGRFQLNEDDADVLVQIRGGDVMWQKERLLNIALKSLPAGCDTVAWLDCDVVFGREDWADDARRALDDWALVHLFNERFDLPRQFNLERWSDWKQGPTSESVVFRIAAGRATPEDLFLANAPMQRRSTAGLAWASRRELLERHGLYDACILGTGDRVILCAALGEFDWARRAVMMNAARTEHYLAWSRRYFNSVRGRVGYIPGPLLHLWHGEIADRLYGERHRGLEHFDPRADIVLDDNGCWRWSSDKREMHAFVRTYFDMRKEDGERGPTLDLAIPR